VTGRSKAIFAPFWRSNQWHSSTVELLFSFQRSLANCHLLFRGTAAAESRFFSPGYAASFRMTACGAAIIAPRGSKTQMAQTGIPRCADESSPQLNILQPNARRLSADYFLTLPRTGTGINT
jgi:hypothetical protein